MKTKIFQLVLCHTVAAIKNTYLKNVFTHLSTAGGAFLESLEGKDLPGIKVLKRN